MSSLLTNLMEIEFPLWKMQALAFCLNFKSCAQMLNKAILSALNACLLCYLQIHILGYCIYYTIISQSKISHERPRL